MTLRLNGSTSGYTEIDAPAVAGSNTLVLPGGNGSADQVLGGNGAGVLSWVDRGRMVLETAKASTSGTSVDFTGIPSWVKRVTVMFDGVSLNGASEPMIQLGTSGGVQTTGYNGTAALAGVSNGAANFSAGFITVVDAAAANLIYGSAILTLLNTSGIWAYSSNFSFTNYTSISGGSKSLSGTLDRIRITTVNGTDTFDAGSINILYEG